MSPSDKPKAAIFSLGECTYVTRFHRNVETLKELGLQVCCFSLKPRNISDTKPFEGVLIDGWTRRFRHKVFGPLRCFEVFLRFLFAIIKCNPDVLYAHNVPGLVIGWITACLLGRKKRILIYDAMELECGRAPGVYSLLPFLSRNSLILSLEKFLVKRADLVTSADYARTEQMKKKLGRDDILTCRNVPVFREVNQSTFLQEELSLQKGIFIFLYQGIISIGRGIEVAIKSLKGLPDEIIFVIMGMGTDHYKNSLRQLSESEGLSKRVFLLPPVPSDELLDWTASADVIHSLIENVCLSYYLAAPNKLYEAAMAGIPVIASRFPEMEAVLTRHPYGCLVNPESTQKIANALLYLYENPSVREEFGQMALKASQEELNWEMESQELKGRISSLVKEKVLVG